jgi:hypothetical protein
MKKSIVIMLLLSIGTTVFAQKKVVKKGEKQHFEILYEKEQIRQKGIIKQRLLIPEIVELSSREKAETTFIETGKTPTEVTMDGMKDRTIVEDLASTNIKTPRAYKDLKDKDVIDLKPEEYKVEKVEKFDDPIANKAAENISFEPTKNPLTVEQIKETAKKAKRKFIIEIVDQKYPVLEALREAGVKTKTGIEKLNPYESLRILEGSSGRASYFIEHKTLDFKTLADKGPGLIEILEPIASVSKKELQLFSAYLANRHALTLAKRGKETGIDIGNAKIFVEKYWKNYYFCYIWNNYFKYYYRNINMDCRIFKHLHSNS